MTEGTGRTDTMGHAGADEQHLRPRLPPVRGTAARAARRDRRPCHPQPPDRLGPRSQHAFEDRAGRPAGVRAAALARRARDRRGRVPDRRARRGHRGALTDPLLEPLPDHGDARHALQRRTGAGAVRPRPARRCAAALLLAGDRALRLCGSAHARAPRVARVPRADAPAHPPRGTHPRITGGRRRHRPGDRQPARRSSPSGR